MKKLPIGIQSFEILIKENYTYVDKTEYIYKLISEGRIYFLSRPRRFGKSLTVSTLENIFKGKKELFEGLYIYDKIEWKEYPVIRIDLSVLYYKTPQNLEESFLKEVNNIGKSYGITLTEDNYKSAFKELIEKLSKKGKVVVLIDEYDKPIIDFITEPEINKQNRDILKNFYGILKGMDDYLKFVFITGVSKFSRTSIFSELNNLNDITIDERYNSILGYKKEDINKYFNEYINKLSNKFNEGKDEILKKIELWYNGYNWSGNETLYNPFSILNLFDHLDFKNYWFKSGTPTFLVNLMKERNYPLLNIENLILEEDVFDVYEVENIGLEALLFQTGYLTIKDTKLEDVKRYYKLYYPNLEVKDSLLNVLFKEYCGQIDTNNGAKLLEMKKLLKAEKIDNFFEYIKTIFAGIPYEIFVNKEDYYNSIIYTILSLTGIEGSFELMTNIGRLDCALELKDKVYIFEFKLNSTGQQGINQIKEKKYYEKYLNTGKKIYIIGVGFNSKTRNIKNWKYEVI